MDTCLNCFRPYKIVALRQRFCSAKCQRQNALLTDLLARGPVDCPGCGNPFLPLGPRRKFCSGRCAGKVRSRRGSLRRLTICERDGWVCGLCDEPIDPSLEYPDPWCGTSDHIVPLSRGGPDEAGNLQAAHWACNFAKGDAVLHV